MKLFSVHSPASPPPQEQPRTLRLREDKFPSQGQRERILQINQRQRKNKGLNKYVEKEEVFN